MSVFLIKGLSALIFGLGFGSGQKAYHKYKGSLWDLKYSPCTVRPSPRYAFAVKDMEEFKRAEEEWIKYNELRKYYFNLLVQRSKEIDTHSSFYISKQYIETSKKTLETERFKREQYGIRRNGQPPDKYQFEINLENRLKNISQINIGSDYILDKRYEDIYTEMEQSNVSLIYRPEVDYHPSCERLYRRTLKDILITEPNVIENMSMNYKRFYKPEYV